MGLQSRHNRKTGCKPQILPERPSSGGLSGHNSTIINLFGLSDFIMDRRLLDESERVKHWENIKSAYMQSVKMKNNLWTAGWTA
jgi:hypothetical protein